MCGWLSQFSAWGNFFFSMPPKAKSKRKAMAAAQEQFEAEEEYISAEEAEGLEEGEDDDPPTGESEEEAEEATPKSWKPRREPNAEDYGACKPTDLLNMVQSKNAGLELRRRTVATIQQYAVGIRMGGCPEKLLVNWAVRVMVYSSDKAVSTIGMAWAARLDEIKNLRSLMGEVERKLGLALQATVMLDELMAPKHNYVRGKHSQYIATFNEIADGIEATKLSPREVYFRLHLDRTVQDATLKREIGRALDLNRKKGSPQTVGDVLMVVMAEYETSTKRSTVQHDRVPVRSKQFGKAPRDRRSQDRRQDLRKQWSSLKGKDEKFKFAREHGLCGSCGSKGHIARDCPENEPSDPVQGN